MANTRVDEKESNVSKQKSEHTKASKAILFGGGVLTVETR